MRASGEGAPSLEQASAAPILISQTDLIAFAKEHDYPFNLASTAFNAAVEVAVKIEVDEFEAYEPPVPQPGEQLQLLAAVQRGLDRSPGPLDMRLDGERVVDMLRIWLAEGYKVPFPRMWRSCMSLLAHMANDYGWTGDRPLPLYKRVNSEKSDQLFPGTQMFEAISIDGLYRVLVTARSLKKFSKIYDPEQNSLLANLLQDVANYLVPESQDAYPQELPAEQGPGVWLLQLEGMGQHGKKPVWGIEPGAFMDVFEGTSENELQRWPSYRDNFVQEVVRRYLDRLHRLAPPADP